MAAFTGRPLDKTPTNRTESVEVLVERPVYPTKPCQPTETVFAQSPNVSKLAEILCLGLFLLFAETPFQFQIINLSNINGSFFIKHLSCQFNYEVSFILTLRIMP